MEPGNEHWHRPRRPGIEIFGMVAAVVLAIGGLVFIGAIVILYVGLSQYGSNKRSPGSGSSCCWPGPPSSPCWLFSP